MPIDVRLRGLHSASRSLIYVVLRFFVAYPQPIGSSVVPEEVTRKEAIARNMSKWGILMMVLLVVAMLPLLFGFTVFAG